MENRKDILEKYIKQMKEGIPFAEEFIDVDPNDIRNNSLLARNLTEDALAHEVLKNTGVPIPDKRASRLKKEDFLNRIANEVYPDFSNPNIRLGDDSSYYKGKTTVNSQNDLLRNVSDSLHEMGHKYDTEKLKVPTDEILDEKSVRKMAKTMNLRDKDPLEVYELISKNHHATIPDIREESYGLSNLKNALKGKPIRSLVGPMLGVGLGLATGSDAMAAVPILGDSEDVGNADDDFEMIGEAQGNNNYKDSKARQDRLNALNKLKGE